MKTESVIETKVIPSSIGDLTLTRTGPKILLDIYDAWVEKMKVSVKTTGVLRRVYPVSAPVSYCCIGVLCVVDPDLVLHKETSRFQSSSTKDRSNGGVLPTNCPTRSSMGVQKTANLNIDNAGSGPINGSISFISDVTERRSVRFSLAAINDQLIDDEDFATMIKVIDFFYGPKENKSVTKK